MDFRQLMAFLAVAECRSFSEAADRLYLSQPTVSSHVRALEKELGTRLIYRSTKRFELSPEGRRLESYARSILDLRDKARREISGKLKTELHLGASSVPSQCVLPEILASFREERPDVSYRIYHSDSLDVIDQVNNGIVDLGLVGTTGGGDCRYLSFGLDELVLVTPRQEPYLRAKAKGEKGIKLLNSPLIMRSDQSGTRKETDRILKGLGVKEENLEVIAYMNDSECILRSVALGLGASIISSRRCRAMEERGEILSFPLTEGRFTRNLYLAYIKSEIMPPIARDFLRHVQQLTRGQGCLDLLSRHR